MDKLDADDSRPPYHQIADRLRADITTGVYSPGDKLPSHKEVAARYGVSVGTVKRAFVLLQSQKLIVTRQGQGSFVRSRPDDPDLIPPDTATRLDALTDLVTDLMNRVAALEERRGAKR